ncbi:hypothetical protein IW140_000290 [Coemansia sp. RSA 1813]|nr:hypothetical protein EV178_000491 [Coemansia sp. RSA 1646]KAJ1773739.1 hypothetical protein LPJ74_000282 [Coemansia sp. RSA 1843]KAJ2093700.1 hypothetical protein IW138_000095 [Coemansia sp. RSA 986]KAJ2217915.1 hypothetical protein EV179_000059 [Coemansia sp. RSA 487]KAJ2573246.1 hypothetical protein IW140_000290 [Coemansia sp. RSA 1813]
MATARPSTLKGSSITLVELARHNMYAKPTIVALPLATQNHAGFQDVAQQQAACNVQNTDVIHPYNTHSGRTHAQNHHMAESSVEATSGEPKCTPSFGKQDNSSKQTTFSHIITSNPIRRAGRVRLDLGRLSKIGGVATKAAVDLFHFRKQQPASNRPTIKVAPPCSSSAAYADESIEQLNGPPLMPSQQQQQQQPPLDYARYCRPPVFGPSAQSKYATMYIFNKSATVYPPQFQDAEDISSDSSTVYNSSEEEDSFRLVEIKRIEAVVRCMPQLVNIGRSGDNYNIVPALQQLHQPTE